MATRYPRLGVQRDPALESALARTARLLSEHETRSAAAQVRALALRGAEALTSADDPASELRRRLYERHEVVPAEADPSDFEAPPEAVDPDDPTPASDALRWVRGKD